MLWLILFSLWLAFIFLIRMLCLCVCVLGIWTTTAFGFQMDLLFDVLKLSCILYRLVLWITSVYDIEQLLGCALLRIVCQFVSSDWSSKLIPAELVIRVFCKYDRCGFWALFPVSERWLLLFIVSRTAFFIVSVYLAWVAESPRES